MNKSTTITPTIGRKVWFWPNGTHIGVPAAAQPQSQDPAQAMDATIVFVHSDRMVNLQVVDHAGFPWSVPSVTLQQEGDATTQGMYAQWMPYQTGQAKKEAQPVQLPGANEHAQRAMAEAECVERANRFKDVFVSGIEREGPAVRCTDLATDAAEGKIGVEALMAGLPVGPHTTIPGVLIPVDPKKFGVLTIDSAINPI